MKRMLNLKMVLGTLIFVSTQFATAHGDGGLFAVIFSSTYAAAGLTTTIDDAPGHHHHHYHHRHRHYHWKKEAKRTLNEIKIYKQNGELSEALQKKMKAIDKAESGRYQNLSTKKKIKLIKLVMQAVLLEKDA